MAFILNITRWIIGLSLAGISLYFYFIGYGIIFVFNAAQLIHPVDNFWYFPGDPPEAEITLIFGAIGSACALLSYLITPRGKISFHVRVLGKERKLTGVFVAMLLLPLIIPLDMIASRNFGEMGRLKTELQKYETLVEQEFGETPKAISDERWCEVKNKLFTPNPEVHLKGSSTPVKIRLVRRIPPYVGADFGNGGVAVFDLRTMECIYSD